MYSFHCSYDALVIWPLSITHAPNKVIQNMKEAQLVIEIAGFQLQTLKPLPNIGKGCQMQDEACNLLQNVRMPG
jgi:hypothetical protein